MRRVLAVALAIGAVPPCALGALRLMEESYLPQGMFCVFGYVPVFDSDRDGKLELFMNTNHGESASVVLAAYERVRSDSFDLVLADTGNPYPPQGITTGNLGPDDVGLLDMDSLVDLIGTNSEEYPPDSAFLAVCQHEARSLTSHPDTFVWYARYANNVAQSENTYLVDLDQDGRHEMLLSQEQHLLVYESNGDNSCRLAFRGTNWGQLSRFAVGDLDQDGRTEFATAGWRWGSYVRIWECAGNDTYALVDSLLVNLPNGHDVFEGRDVDQNGRPEFFVSFGRYTDDYMTYHLYQIEAVADNRYDTFPVATALGIDGWGVRSKCGDIDGDGVDEIVWSVRSHILVYKGVGPHRFQQVGYWWNHGSNDLSVNIHDMNRDGYNEVICSGSDRTYVLGLDAVRVRFPNGGESFEPGETTSVRWQWLEPPRCDSASLFLSLDNGRTFDTLAASLSPADTAVAWVVPDVRSESCRVRAVVYGPGWRADESDTRFRIGPTGIEDGPQDGRVLPCMFLSPSVVRDGTTIRFMTAGRGTLRVYRADGAVVRDLTGTSPESGHARWDRCDDAGRQVPAGVYLVRLAGEEGTVVRKVVVR